MSDHSFNSETMKRNHEVELTNDELDRISGGAMSPLEYMLFMGQLAAWAKEKGSQPVRLPGL